MDAGNRVVITTTEPVETNFAVFDQLDAELMPEDGAEPPSCGTIKTT